MDQFGLSVIETTPALPATFSPASDRSGGDAILRLVQRELAKGRSTRQLADRRRAADRRGRQFERRALAAVLRP